MTTRSRRRLLVLTKVWLCRKKCVLASHGYTCVSGSLLLSLTDYLRIHGSRTTSAVPKHYRMCPKNEPVAMKRHGKVNRTTTGSVPTLYFSSLVATQEALLSKRNREFQDGCNSYTDYGSFWIISLLSEQKNTNHPPFGESRACSRALLFVKIELLL